MAPHAAKIRPYKDFLTPALHRRFIAAYAVCFGLCYLESILIGKKTSFFWLWFPLGKTSLRAALLSISALSIFLLRVAQLHVGYRTSYSAWNTFKLYTFQFQTLQTVIWYSISAYLFFEIYTWSASTEAGLSRVKNIPRTNRSTLNEKHIYLMCFFFFLAFINAAIHLFKDYDRIEIPIKKYKVASSSRPENISAFHKLKARIPHLAFISIKRSILISFISPFLYAFNFRVYPYSIRRLAWNLNRSWAKIVWTLPKSSLLPNTWPFNWVTLRICVTTGFLLTFLWEVSNAAFSIYTAQEPLKNGRPITQESRDSNGSLLNGLRSRKLQTKVYAFWELSYISHKHKTRRKSIFDDIDRDGGSSWSQICDACLDVINGISTRIDNYKTPSVFVSHTTDNIPSLPRLSEPIRKGLNSPGDIFTNVPKPLSPVQNVVRTTGDFAKSRGQPKPHGPSKGIKLIHAAETIVLTKQQRETISKFTNGSIKRWWLVKFLESHFGWFFRHEYQRILATIVLGNPYGDAGIIVDAIESLARLVLCSLKEDQYGKVQRDVKHIIILLTNVIINLENFIANTDVHWTDVKVVKMNLEVDQILVSLKENLKNILSAFEIYSDNIGLNQRDLRMAKQVAVISNTYIKEE